ncbi:MAG: hypothetical protein R3E83_20505 [Burkholderiaceae bacterium]
MGTGGGGGRDRPAGLLPSARVARRFLLPYGVYRGALLRADDGQVGLRALRDARFEMWTWA